MTAFIRRPLSQLGVPLSVGIWAAALAVTPDLRVRLALFAIVPVASILWWSLLRPTLWLKLFFLSAILLPPLPITFGGSNPHLAVLLAVLGFFIGLLRYRRWQSLHGHLLGAFGLFTAALLLSITFAALYSGMNVAVASFARVLLFAIGPYIFFYTLGERGHFTWRGDLGFVRFLFTIAIVAALFACVDFYFQFPAPASYGPQFIWLEEGVFRRAQGLFYEASTLGNFCVFFLVMIAVAICRPRRERPFALPVLLTGGAILAAALIFSYSRASLLNLAIALCILAWLQGLTFRRGILILGVAASTALAVNALFPSFAHSYWLRLAASLRYFWSSPEGVLSGRVSSWRIIIDFLTREPWNALFGIGYKSLPYSDYVGSNVIGDNTYLTLLIETGVFGLSSFMYLNYLVLRYARRAARAMNPEAQFLGRWIFCFWIGELAQMLSGDLITYWRVLPIYFWTLAVAIRHTHGTQELLSHPPPGDIRPALQLR
jgi:hypothetical protein